MLIMAVNAGSSSLKFSILDMENNNVISSGNFERIGIEESFYTIKYDDNKIKEIIELPNISVAVKILFDKLIALNIINDLNDIDAVGHRIVQGLDVFKESCLINDDVIKKLDEIKGFAPLHNPKSLETILAFRDVVPNTPMVCVFDTSFHQSMTEDTFLYAVPYDWYTKYSVRKYGAHGTSHRYIAREVEKILGKKEFKLISCHLGSGGSICAIKDGKCVDTSMGFTPLAGIMMGTRSGDIDSSLIPYIMSCEGKNCFEVINDLNTNSGLLGVSGVSSDMRDIDNAIEEGNHRAELAKEKYVRRVVDYIAQYYVLLGGVDVIVFTAGVGENNADTRERIVKCLDCLGVKLDKEKNNTHDFSIISSKNSKVLVYIIPTDEEKMICLDTQEIVNKINN